MTLPRLHPLHRIAILRLWTGEDQPSEDVPIFRIPDRTRAITLPLEGEIVLEMRERFELSDGAVYLAVMFRGVLIVSREVEETR